MSDATTRAISPTGTQLELASGGYTAVVTTVGATLRRLHAGERPLVVGYDESEPMPLYRGAVLVPWANRIGDGRYVFGGREHQLPLNEVARMTALHGLVLHLEWEVLERSESAVELGCRVWPQPGYPFLLDVRVRYALADDGCTVTVATTNAGDEPAPYGVSIHPYLTAGSGRADEWTLHVPAASVVEVDPERLLPTGTIAPVDGTPLDFRTPHRVGDVQIDHAYGDLVADADGTATASVVGPDGVGAAMTWDAAALPWLQIHTADRPEPENDRVGMAVEPMTAPPDSFTTGRDLITLAPGETHTASWRIWSVSSD